MSRRVRTAILLVTTLAIVVFAIPLGIGARRLYRDEVTTRLERTAQAAAAGLAGQLAQNGSTAAELPDDAGVELAAYDATGRRIDGQGPPEGDASVAAALNGTVQDRTIGERIVVAVPVNDEDQVIGAVRASVATSTVDDRTHRAWLAMAGLGLAVLALAVFVARLAARRIARPVTDLAASARRLGEGDFTVEPARSGIPELDDVGAAIAATAGLLGTAIDRERAFSADASHQLRTPVTSLRLRLEATQVDPAADRDTAIALALDEIDRLERTINDLIDLGRDQSHRGDVPLDIAALLDDLEHRWHGLLAADGRPLRVSHQSTLRPIVAAAAAREALDVLVDNARRHGRGEVTIRSRDADQAVALDVLDEGPGPVVPDVELFRRRSPSAAGSGIGLALARALIQAQGGRLIHASGEAATRFTIMLPRPELDATHMTPTPGA